MPDQTTYAAKGQPDPRDAIIERYGRHRPECRSLPMDMRSKGDCECGWFAIRQARDVPPAVSAQT